MATQGEDTCSPGKNKVLQSFRTYSIIFPFLILFLIFEAILIISYIPTGSLGTALTVKGSLPPLSSSHA
jgi:hypothetical protein